MSEFRWNENVLWKHNKWRKTTPSEHTHSTIMAFSNGITFWLSTCAECPVRLHCLIEFSCTFGMAEIIHSRRPRMHEMNVFNIHKFTSVIEPSSVSIQRNAHRKLISYDCLYAAPTCLCSASWKGDYSRKCSYFLSIECIDWMCSCLYDDTKITGFQFGRSCFNALMHL